MSLGGTFQFFKPQRGFHHSGQGCIAYPISSPQSPIIQDVFHPKIFVGKSI
jgi:hypothetical protein